MAEFLCWLMGIDRATLPEGAEIEMMFTHAPRSWMVFVMVAVVVGLLYGVFRFYRRENEACPPNVRLALAGIRGLIILLVALIALGPSLAVTLRKTIEPYVILLLDDSRSMSIRDRYRNDAERARVAKATGKTEASLKTNAISRAELVTEILQRDDAKFIRALAKKGQLRVMSFSDKVLLRNVVTRTQKKGDGKNREDEFLGLKTGEPIPPLMAEGSATNMARGMREALKSATGQPVAALVMITDGQNTSGDDPLRMADRARVLSTPVFTVGIGDPNEPRNLKLAEMWAPESAFRTDPIVVQASIRARGLGEAEVQVELLSRPADEEGDGMGKVIATETVRVGGERKEIRVALKSDAKTAGKFIYTVRVADQPGELLKEDNARSAVVNVLDEKAKVLLISGGPTWDYRLVKNLLIRDKTINVSCWLQSMDKDMRQEGNTVIDRLPTKPEELYQYDVVLLLDPDPQEFNGAWIDALKKFVGTHAGGMLWMSGPKHTLRFLSLPRTEGIRDILPVKTDGLQGNLINSIGAIFKREWPMRARADGLDHPLLQITRNPKINKRIWAVLPGVHWSFPVTEAKPATRVLLEHSSAQMQGEHGARPLLVTGQYGPGRTIYMGFRGTWRWRRTGLEHFDRFWIQTVRYLLEGGLSRGRRRGRVNTDRDTYSIGDQVQINAKIYDEQFRPIEKDEQTVHLHTLGKDPIPVVLKPVPQRKGVYTGSIQARQLGLNELKLSLPGSTAGAVIVTRQFTVEVPNIEYADPRLNKTLLRDIAKRAGGDYFAVDETEKLVEAIPDRRATIISPEKPRSLWDNSRVLFLLVLLLTIEWALRKKFRLL